MKKLFYSSACNIKRGPLAINPNLFYVGGFYYKNSRPTPYKDIVRMELDEIGEADIVMANLLEYPSIATIAEIVYAAKFPQKEIIVFCNPKIAQPENNREYLFPILAAKRMNNNVQVVYVESEDEILDFIKDYGRSTTSIIFERAIGVRDSMPSKRAIIATNNDGKLRELRELFPDHLLLGLKDAGIKQEVVEDGKTFLENARKKAMEIYHSEEKSPVPVIADDSGLRIDDLDGFPGVLTHRFLGENATDEERNMELIRRASGSIAHFTCVIVHYDGDHLTIGHGDLVGKIASSPRGKNGFGFDPIFELPDRRTLAELCPEEKNAISARHLAAVDLALKLN